MVLVALGTSLVVSLGWGWVALRCGPSLGYVDVPDDPELKAHVRTAVPLGGVGLFAAFHIGSVAAGTFDLELLLSSGILLSLGLADDRFDLAPMARLAVEAVAGAILGMGFGRGWPAAVVIAVFVVVAVNAVNLFDGLDGLAAGSGAVSALGIAALAGVRGTDPVAALILTAALVGFLRWNWHPARLFLGDNGAYVLGGILVALVVRAGSDPLEFGLGATVLGVYFLDLAITIVRRLVGHRPLFGGDRNHVYDLLRARGLSVPGVAVVAASTQALFAVAAFLGDSIETPTWAALPVGSVTVLVVLALGLTGVLTQRPLPR